MHYRISGGVEGPPFYLHKCYLARLFYRSFLSHQAHLGADFLLSYRAQSDLADLD